MSQALVENRSVPAADWLVTQYALGRLPRAAALLAETYLEMNPNARQTATHIEQLGGWSLEMGQPVPLSDGATAAAILDRIMKFEAVPVPCGSVPGSSADGSAGIALPGALAAAVKHPLASLPWKWRSVGAYEYRLKELEDDGIVARLLRIEPGRAVPQHTHMGMEATLVLSGAYVDDAGRFGAGDLEIADDAIDHQPIAETGQTCLCFAVTEAPMKMTGPFGRLIQSFL